MSMRKSNDTNGNRTLDQPACNAVPQLTVPPKQISRNKKLKAKHNSCLSRTLSLCFCVILTECYIKLFSALYLVSPSVFGMKGSGNI